MFGTNVSSAVKIPSVPGTAKVQGYDDGNWFVADSFSFGVEPELSRTVAITPGPTALA